ncbi:MAG: carboxypeptidase M32 [Isosphaeraceae bacterium]
MDPQPAYDELMRRSRELATLGSCSALLGWDEQTYMPSGAAIHRGSQMALLAGLHHERATDPRIGDLLALVEGSSLVTDPESGAAVNIRELRRSYDRRVRLPKTLVEELARTTSLAQGEWVTARSANDFGRFRPWLEKIFQLKRAESACLQGGLELTPTGDAPGWKPPAAAATSATDPAAAGQVVPVSVYDPLIDEYEPGARSAQLAVLFQELRRELVPMVSAITAGIRHRAARHSSGPSTAVSQGPVGEAVLQRFYPRERQKVFGEGVAAAIGFDFTRGRLDVTAHPFCSGIGPGDCRITTRYDEHHFSEAFSGILHEAGHGLYEQGLDGASYGTPMGEAVSLGVHESQSRLWENAVGRGRAFWTYWFPLARSIFHEALADVTLDQFHAALNHVAPSLIRVSADEATYNLHIIVRFELEQDLLSGNLPAAELPAAWNQKYQETLGVTPPDDAAGCLQDIHWSAGLIGYFPTYTLGNLYAAQLFAQAQTDLGGLDQAFARGDFRGLLEWLRANVHRHGQRYRPAALIERITGTKPDHRPLIDALRQKYGELYGI